MPREIETRPSPWPHRLALALALVTFPLIWVGGLVTTYDAGMAVPDWPGTYGYNLFHYPWQTWLAGPWDLFIEHGHRLLGATAGILAIALVVVVWITDRRPLLVRLSLGALVLVILQGALGGARVLFNERQIALVHACVGPLFFAYLAVLLVATLNSRNTSTHAVQAPSQGTPGSHFASTAILLTSLSYLQLVLGAILRHVPLTAGTGVFRAALWLHLALAAGLFVIAALAASRAWPLRSIGKFWPVLSSLVLFFVTVQIALGSSTYVLKYAFPGWMQHTAFAARFVVQERSLTQALVTTAHVATGSLILFAATFQAASAALAFLPLAKRDTAVVPLGGSRWLMARRAAA